MVSYSRKASVKWLRECGKDLCQEWGWFKQTSKEKKKIRGQWKEDHSKMFPGDLGLVCMLVFNCCACPRRNLAFRGRQGGLRSSQAPLGPRHSAPGALHQQRFSS